MPERTLPPIRRLLTVDEAAVYLGCSVRHFREVVQPHLPMVDLARPGAGRTLPRWDVEDLAAFVVRRKPGQPKEAA